MRGKRKVFVISLAILAAFVLSMAGKMTAEFSQVAIAAVLAFGGANAVEHWRNGKDS